MYVRACVCACVNRSMATYNKDNISYYSAMNPVPVNTSLPVRPVYKNSFSQFLRKHLPPRRTCVTASVERNVTVPLVVVGRWRIHQLCRLSRRRCRLLWVRPHLQRRHLHGRCRVVHLPHVLDTQCPHA